VGTTTAAACGLPGKRHRRRREKRAAKNARDARRDKAYGLSLLSLFPRPFAFFSAEELSMRNRPKLAQTGGSGQWQVKEADCAKQTQFAADGQGRPSPRPSALTLPPVGGNCAEQSQFRQRAERAKFLVGEELWWIRHACQTKPIPADAGWDEAAGTQDAEQMC
jgi:hypothetical protein